MKFFSLLLPSFLFFSCLAGAAPQVEHSLYLRAGTGANDHGGGMTCVGTPGLPGNFMRLGNECGSYGEWAVRLSPEGAQGKTFAQLRWAFSQPLLEQWEDSDSDQREVGIIEAFVAVAHETLPGTLWIGKRFYRENDIAILDWYAFADMSAVGAGLEAIPLGEGKLSLAHLLKGKKQDTNQGTPLMHVLDLRFEQGAAKTWLALGQIPEFTQDGKTSPRRGGVALGSRYRLESGHEIAALAGQGVMEGLNIYAPLFVEAEQDCRARAYRFRVFDNYVAALDPRWSLQAAAVAEVFKASPQAETQGQFQVVALRPTYHWSDHTRSVLEAGWARFSEGGATPAKELRRWTLAQEWAWDHSVWSRPVFRAFVSLSSWNADNPQPVWGTAGQSANFGYQAEVWF